MPHPRPTRRRRHALLGLAAGGALGAALGGAAAAQDAFRDDFESFDRDRWYVSDGWSNGDWQACTWSERMVTVGDGLLRLSLAPTEAGSSDYLCAEVQSNGEFGYGTYEARLRTDRASGVNAAFFTYIGPVHDRTHEEIDVEILTRDPSRFDVNTYRDGQSAGGQSVALPTDADAEFHTYSFTWAPDAIRWYVDGALVHEATGADLPQPPQKVFLSHWNSRTFTDWMGAFEDPGRPLDLVVDWVAFTPAGEGCRFEGSALCAPGASDAPGAPDAGLEVDPGVGE